MTTFLPFEVFMTCSPLNTDSHGFFNCFYDSAVIILQNFKLFWSGVWFSLRVREVLGLSECPNMLRSPKPFLKENHDVWNTTKLLHQREIGARRKDKTLIRIHAIGCQIYGSKTTFPPQPIHKKQKNTNKQSKEIKNILVRQGVFNKPKPQSQMCQNVTRV